MGVDVDLLSALGTYRSCQKQSSESNVIESIYIYKRGLFGYLMFLGSGFMPASMTAANLRLVLSTTDSIDYIVITDGHHQHEVREIESGVTNYYFNLHRIDGCEIVLMKGGEVDWQTHTGGECVTTEKLHPVEATF